MKAAGVSTNATLATFRSGPSANTPKSKVSNLELNETVRQNTRQANWAFTIASA
jgi:hypothetical protein